MTFIRPPSPFHVSHITASSLNTDTAGGARMERVAVELAIFYSSNVLLIARAIEAFCLERLGAHDHRQRHSRRTRGQTQGIPSTGVWLLRDERSS
jgi:hypothetical protein